jgi:feruloyl esterase
MRPTRVESLLGACVLAWSATVAHAAGSRHAPIVDSCEQLASLALPNATVTAARAYPAGEFAAGRTFQVPAFCRVMVTARPSPDSDIKVEVWLPEAWNGKLLGTDNGGFSGAINYAGLAAGITKGHAAVSTDTGHTGDQMDFGASTVRISGRSPLQRAGSIDDAANFSCGAR